MSEKKPARKKTAKKTTRKSTKKTAAKKAAPKRSTQKHTASGKTASPPVSGNGAADNPTALEDAEAVMNYDQFGSAAGFVQEITEKGEELMKLYSQPLPNSALNPVDPLTVGQTVTELMTNIFRNPAVLMQAQLSMWQGQMQLMENLSHSFTGTEDDTPPPPRHFDRRFSHKSWSENPALKYVKDSYQLYCDWARGLVQEADGLDDHTRKKAEFYTEQYLAAIAPTNFAATNPEVLEEMVATGGENLLRGYQNFMDDFQRGKGELAMKQVDLDFFKVGENLATTPGKVIFQNELMQLIQYDPVTEQVAKRPMIIFPPWINKFYILDLQPANSFIKWLVEQGRTVFVVSWVNPGPELRGKQFSDYITDGVMAALEAAEQATGVKGADTIGYCIGGTMLAAALAYMAEKRDDRIKTATFFTSQFDFVEAGDLLVFIDEEQLDNLEEDMDQAGGVLEATRMSNTFNMLRPVDMIWSVYVDNYLKGKDAKKFDLLFWNADSTRMLKDVHIFYLRECYLKNSLSRGEMSIDGVKLDLGKIKIPVFMQAAEKDHIAPYRSVYRSARLLGGDNVTYMLAGSGHIAGVVNPPSAQKYHYSTNTDLPETVEEWMDEADRHAYSWWDYWLKWLNRHSKGKVTARKPGDSKLKPLEDAPGSYVKVRATP